ncbi:MAG: winged helix-turn-helix domain-containing protein, partial [Myxococcota bacterium]
MGWEGPLRLESGWLDLHEEEVRTSEGLRPLTRIETRLLRYLLAAGRPVDQDELLQEVWGYAAAVQSRTVRVTVSRLRRKLELDPSDPKHLVTIAGEGYALVVTQAAPTDASDSRRTNVPSDRDRFVGRSDLLARLAAAPRLTTLVGPSGVGKSRLARNAARSLLDAGGVGAWWVDLPQAPTSIEVLDVLRRITGQPGSPDDQAIVGAFLHGLGPTVLVLDEAEGVPTRWLGVVRRRRWGRLRQRQRH